MRQSDWTSESRPAAARTRKLKGVDDLRNDPEVEVGIYANADPIALSASRAALPFATYAASQEQRYRAVTRGRIVNGVLTIDPVDFRVPNVLRAGADFSLV